MEEISVNRLPAITWRYLHVNDSPDQFEFPGNSASAVFLINGMCRKAARFLLISAGHRRKHWRRRKKDRHILSSFLKIRRPS